MAQAQFPSRPIRIVIGFPPGGGIDILARLMAPKMADRLGQPVVVENRPGANGLIATQGVAQSEPDGHTIFFGTTGNLAVNPAIYAGRSSLDIERDFTALSLVASLPFVLVVNPSVPAKSLAELIAFAKARPGEVLFGSSGNGGLPHLSGELLSLQAGITTRHVPYRGSAPAFTDLISGQVQFVFDALAIAQPHIESGKLRALATTGPTRMAALPDVPLARDTLPKFEVVNWYGMVVRAGTPAAIVSRLNQEVANALRQSDVAERAASLGLDLVGSTPEQFAALQRDEIAKWGGLIRAANIKVD
jgi:tripartite-type tricarboxylate transporter receptor subunit TctC